MEKIPWKWHFISLHMKPWVLVSNFKRWKWIVKIPMNESPFTYLTIQLGRDHSACDGDYSLMAEPERWYFSIFPFSDALPHQRMEQGVPWALTGSQKQIFFVIKYLFGLWSLNLFFLGTRETNVTATSHKHYLYFELFSDTWGNFANICLSWVSNHLPELHSGIYLQSGVLIFSPDNQNEPYWSLTKILI